MTDDEPVKKRHGVAAWVSFALAIMFVIYPLGIGPAAAFNSWTFYSESDWPHSVTSSLLLLYQPVTQTILNSPPSLQRVALWYGSPWSEEGIENFVFSYEGYPTPDDVYP